MKKVFLLLFLCVARSAWCAQVYLDTFVSHDTGQDPVSSFVFNIAVNNVQNRMAIVFFCTEGGVTSDVAASGVTLGGSTMTLTNEAANTGGNTIHLYSYRRLAPSVGAAQQISVTFTTARRAIAGAMILYNVNSISQLRNFGTVMNANDTTTVSRSETVIDEEAVADIGCKRGTTDAITMGTQTNRVERWHRSTSALSAGNDVTGGSSTVFNYSGNAVMNWTSPVIHALGVSTISAYAQRGMSPGVVLLPR